MLNPISTAVLVVFYVVCAILLVGLIGGLLFALVKLNTLLTVYQQQVENVLTKADRVLTLANEKLLAVGDKTEDILTTGRTMTAQVSDRVDKTAAIVQKTVSAPFIGINSVAAGLKRAVTTFGELRNEVPAGSSNAPVKLVDPVPPTKIALPMGK